MNVIGKFFWLVHRSHQYLSNDISFVWFPGRLNFPLAFYNDVILTS